MSNYDKNPPEFTDTILNNQNVVFKVKSTPSLSKHRIWLLEIIFLGFAFFTSFKILENLISFENQEFELNTTFLQNNIEIFLPVGLLLLFIIMLSLIFSVKQIKNLKNDKNYPWFIGSEKFLLIASKNDSVPIPWNYLSRNLKHSKKKNGNLTIPFDRKEFAKEAQKHFPSIVQNHSLKLKNIPNPTLIGEICRTKINK